MLLSRRSTIKQEKKTTEPTLSEAEEPKRRFSPADIIKFAGLVAFFIIMGIVCVLIWPLVSQLFEPGGIEQVIQDVQHAGATGVLILLAIQFLQIVVAFIPGEVVQLAAGMMYGPWFGALIVLIGCVISSAFIFVIVHALGAPFVQDMVPKEYLGRFRRFEESGKLNTIVFILFLIPGLPKDIFTYLVPLTDMRMGTFVLLSNVGRIPGILVSTYAAAQLIQGDIISSVIIFAIAAIVAAAGLVIYSRFMARHDARATIEGKAVEDAESTQVESVSEAKTLIRKDDGSYAKASTQDAPAAELGAVVVREEDPSGDNGRN